MVDNETEETVTLNRSQWAEVLIALVKAEDDSGASEKARERWELALDDIKEQVEIAPTELVEWQETIYKGESNE